MSHDPQWNQFQPPPHMNSTSTADMLHYKTQGQHHNSTPEYNGTYGSNNVYQQQQQRAGYSSGRTQHSPPLQQSNNSSGNNSGRFPIGTFSATEPLYNGDLNSSNHSRQNHSSVNSSYDSVSQSVRETGIIEKLLHSYGFIQCCERQARLFFHFSQFNGNIEHLKIGDPVEFEMTYDRRTGKPIASAVTKIAPEVVLSEERVTGTVTTELPQPDSQGRISYENRGECFFLPYCKEDVEGNVTLRAGDKVSFQIATNQRSGNLAARNVRLENPAHPVRYQGVVCSMKESFGFIERADVVKEIFFHFSEAKSMKEDLQLGDDVEFTIQTRNGKEVACNITRLEPGSVVFEDVGTETIKGQVLKPLERGLARHQNDPLPGRLHYRAPDHSEVEIPFGDKDQQGDFTLRHGDWVQFCIATDRRDSLHRATNIKLLEESFEMSGEKREQGVVAALKDGFGFLRCVDRDSRLFFHFNELLDVDRELRLGDEVEFTVAQDPSQQSRQNATRIAVLPAGTVQFELIVQRDVTGVVSKEAPAPSCWQPRSPTKTSGDKQSGGGESGLITYTANGQKKSISYFFKDCNDPKTVPRVGDKVEFNLCQVKRNKELLAVDVQVTQRAPPPSSTVQSPASRNGNSALTPLGAVGQQCQGYVAALKDGFGFIEASTHDREVFFHFSNYDGEQSLELGMEVEFTLASRNTPGGSCVSAENVKILPKGTIPTPSVDPTPHNGVVVRPLRSVNPDQVEYAGLIRESIAVEETDVSAGENNEAPPKFEFGIVGLANKRDLLQAGDPVTFQVDAEGRATNIIAVRKKKRAFVDAVKGQFGFLAYEVEEGKKLFFHHSEVTDGVNLQPGDTVEFVLVTNQRTNKSSACSIVRVGECKRPERLISKLRSVSLDDSGPRITVIRQPKGPDGTKGFTEPRISRQPGHLNPPALLPPCNVTTIGEEEPVKSVDIPPLSELMAPVAVSDN